MRTSGSRVQNIISRGPGEHELFVTYAFVFSFADIEPETPEAAQKVAQMSAGAARVVPGGVTEMRELAEKGEI
jgi:hypothetical protein